MAVEWNVHSGAEVFGPWSASRIRDELRAGRIDAFDLVSVVGSSVKRSLVEVDQIFETSGVQAAAIVSDVPEASSQDITLIQAEPLSEAKALPQREAVNDRPRAFEALAAPQRVQAPAARHHARKDFGAVPQHGNGRSKAGRKSYMILLPGAGPRGPFTSKDVLILWYAKQLAAGTYIQRVGDAKRIEISRFALFYERAAPSGMAFIGQASLAHSAKDRSIVWLLVAILVAVGILAGAVYWRARRLPVAFITPSSVTLPFTSQEDEGITGNAVIQTATTIMPEKTAALPGKSTIAGVPKSVVKTAPSAKPQASKRAKRRAPQPAYKPSGPATQSSSPQAAPQAVPQAVSQPKPVAPPKVPVAPLLQKPVTGWTDGVMVILSGYSFNVEMLNACEVKCKIPMRGPKGVVTAVFFKEAFGAGLAAKASNVTISGTVHKDPATGGIFIFLQSFR